ncbi:uncharacterized protein C8A04DRAFT_37399 [Dichotomopilus funicola]|uniref:Long-chain-alcohol oxidase n=1 Tax=Dichotomopilus funicola TaxID=1934379 RepID=A0AAN6V207_9PEZI|nr:hypothetical protein C8A04DRAFT_37399 [Dichotomopilus funicola]
MSATVSAETAPLSAPVPIDLPQGDEFLSESSWRVLMALMDTIIPEIRLQEASQTPPTTPAAKARDLSTVHLPSNEYSAAAGTLRRAASPGQIETDAIEAYLAERPSANPAFVEIIHSMLHNLPPSKKRELKIVLSVLNTRPGTLLLTTKPHAFPTLSIADRVKVLHAWSTSPLAQIRGLFKSVTTIAKLAHVRSSTTFSSLTGFPVFPTAWTADGGSSYPYEFLQFHPATGASTTAPAKPVEITTDVVILGSGCGSGVVANRLSSAFSSSINILVLEKGRHFDARHFPLSQATGLANLFEAGGVIETDDGSMTVTAGSCFGGGGTVNWSASLQPQDFVRAEWARERGMGFFESQEFQGCLDRVWEKMGCDEKVVRPNHGNRVLLEGAERLGYKAKVVPQNCGGSQHECGYCTLGCWKGEKKGPVNGWFPEAARQGVKFVEGMTVERVVFGGKGKKGEKVARGVEGKWVSREGVEVKVVVKAKKVVVSCGTLWSPVVLMNSGIKNPQLGKNLYLHPTNFVSGIFDEDVQPWEGGSLTSVVGSFENLDGKGHGVKLERMSMMPSFCLPFLPWTSGPAYKLLAAHYRHLNTFIAICRDRDTGHIYRDPATGRPRIVYSPSDFDRAHNLRGVIELCRIVYAQGGREIHPSIAGMPPFIRRTAAMDATEEEKEKEKAEFESWLARLQALGNKPPVTPFASAHQMGTCRMSAKPKDGVVDEKGRVWGTKGLYVADASVFPSASGVNPMVTTMAIADWIARGVVEELKGEGFTARL